VLLSAAQALRWVFLVPIYQAPDEPVHLDYALAIRAHGGPFRLQNTSLEQLPRHAHPYTDYLVERTCAATIRFNPPAKVPPEYGTKAFYAALDRDAPHSDSLRIDCPNTATVYPFGYYALLAGWLGLIGQATDSIVVMFFAARIFSVLLLAVTLVLSYGTARELNFRPGPSLFVTACLGLFPMTTFVSSYVQPDNLAFTLVSLSFYLALRARRAEYAGPWVALLGLALGGLAVTKVHFWLCVTTAVLGMLATDLPRRRRLRKSIRLWALALLPSLVLGGIYAWTVRGTPNYHWQPAPGLGDPLHWLQAFQDAFLDFYCRTTHASFWGVIGWVDVALVIRNEWVNAAVLSVVQTLSWIILGLTLVRMEQIGSRLWCVARRGRCRLALRAAFSNPVLNSYFLFTAFMFYLYARTNNHFGAQGRNWLPLLLPILLVGLVYAPKALTLPAARRALSAVLAAGLLLYVVAGCHYGIKNLRTRYYLPWHDVARTPLPLEPAERHEMTWENATGDGTGNQPSLLFALPQSTFAYGVQLRCIVTSPEPGANIMRVSWRDDNGPFPDVERSALLRLSPTSGVRTLTLRIEHTISHLCIQPDVRPCHFELQGMTLLHPPPGPGKPAVLCATLDSPPRG
jgi:4-amino-4-deoxy-L-arabinose transferase-like glycosyltransferase